MRLTGIQEQMAQFAALLMYAAQLDAAGVHQNLSPA